MNSVEKFVQKYWVNFFLINQPDALINQSYSVIKLYGGLG